MFFCRLFFVLIFGVTSCWSSKLLLHTFHLMRRFFFNAFKGLASSCFSIPWRFHNVGGERPHCVNALGGNLCGCCCTYTWWTDKWIENEWVASWPHVPLQGRCYPSTCWTHSFNVTWYYLPQGCWQLHQSFFPLHKDWKVHPQSAPYLPPYATYEAYFHLSTTCPPVSWSPRYSATAGAAYEVRHSDCCPEGIFNGQSLVLVQSLGQPRRLVVTMSNIKLLDNE